MLKRLAVLFCLSSLACGGGDAIPTGAVLGGDPGDGGVTAASVVAAPAPPPPVVAVPGLTATFDRGICFVTNSTGQGAAIRYRVSRVVDETDPANYDKQIKVVDETTTVPPGVKDFAVVGMKTPDICGGLFQYDCGRGDGLLAYQFIRHLNTCPTPQPTPTPTPSPTPTPTPSPTPCPSPTPPPPGPPVGTCHVSNKGLKDGNWNLQLSWKLNGEGHEKHTCPDFNPPDFKSTEADCKVANVKFCAGS